MAADLKKTEQNGKKANVPDKRPPLKAAVTNKMTATGSVLGERDGCECPYHTEVTEQEQEQVARENIRRAGYLKSIIIGEALAVPRCKAPYRKK